jgi:hypothetical protein
MRAEMEKLARISLAWTAREREKRKEFSVDI